ncbi:MAG: type IV pilus modification PilV family protein [Planctomycetota bacterium]|jgi:type II secretory pathway pseudopilin PulG
MTKRKLERGVTLIEILLALVVMVIGVIGILALFPPALESQKISMEETVAAIEAESVAHALSTALHFADFDTGAKRWNATFTHDLADGTTSVKYVFILPTLTEGWKHHPDDLPPTPGSPQDDPEFFNTGDGWIQAEHSARRAVDFTDPYHQFAFSFDVRKVNTMEYLLNQVNPDTGVNWTEGEIDSIVNLYEFRIHIFRCWSTGGWQSSGGSAFEQPGATEKRLVATVTHRATTW